MNGDRFHKAYLPGRLPVPRHNLMCRRIQSHPARPPQSTTNAVPEKNEYASLWLRDFFGVPTRPSGRFADSAIKPALVFPGLLRFFLEHGGVGVAGQKQFTNILRTVVLWRGAAPIMMGAMIVRLTVYLAYLEKFFKPVKDLATTTNAIAQAAVGV